jgi:hypothetical protein
MKFNLTKKELENLNGSKLSITHTEIDFDENSTNVIMVINFLRIFSVVSLVSFTFSTLANSKDRQFLVGEYMLILVNWVLIDTAVGKRIIYKSDLYRFITAMNMVAIISFTCMYFMMLKMKHQQGEEIANKSNFLVSFIVIFIALLNVYVVGEIESALMITGLVPIISMAVRSFQVGKSYFSKTYIFAYKPLQIAMPYYWMRLTPPETLFPAD